MLLLPSKLSPPLARHYIYWARPDQSKVTTISSIPNLIFKFKKFFVIRREIHFSQNQSIHNEQTQSSQSRSKYSKFRALVLKHQLFLFILRSRRRKNRPEQNVLSVIVKTKEKRNCIDVCGPIITVDDMFPKFKCCCS